MRARQGFGEIFNGARRRIRATDGYQATDAAPAIPPGYGVKVCGIYAGGHKPNASQCVFNRLVCNNERSPSLCLPRRLVQGCGKLLQVAVAASFFSRIAGACPPKMTFRVGPIHNLSGALVRRGCGKINRGCVERPEWANEVRI